MSTTPKSAGQHSAGAFDIRNIIGIVIGTYGVILLAMGAFFSSPEQLEKSGGLHANLIAGFVMVVVAAVFFTWSHLRPIEVPVTPAPKEQATTE
ncbi:hypothetical protein [Pengzhenrongella frigida]|uniref:Cell wall anchor protein n=1 Tax=Pengzhenrongella frigida TaxID=1259133 RepID=A0A4Q5N3D2_9MICO|nr:hypothetical protein [Cellulomonas sp. HLT2-17]RYV51117.1 hypothetical protein EUA98_10070 [Cellulomonas sp. HLT2-17]